MSWRQHPSIRCIEVHPSGKVRSIERRVRFTTRNGGRAWRLKKARLLTPGLINSGYLVVWVNCGNKVHARTVHSLVAETFIGRRPKGLDVCHNNGNRLDNRARNLRYDTRSSNHLEKRSHGTAQAGEKHHNAKLSDRKVRAILRAPSAANLAGKYGVSARTIRRVRDRETWAHVRP